MIVVTGPVPFVYIGLYWGNFTSHLYDMDDTM